MAMTIGSCAHEKEIVALLASGQWPQAPPDELRAHVAGCRSCGEIALVTSAFRASRTTAAAAAPMVSPGILWWRAQLRRRNAAIERVTRPILGAQIFALVTCVVVGIGFAASHAAQGIGWIGELSQQFRLATMDVAKLWAASGGGSGSMLWVMALLLAMLVLLGGVAVYLASSEER
jgi:hypothetical protein